MFDVITIGTATRDIFLVSKFFKVVRDPEHLKKIGFPTGTAECFALGSKIEVEKPIFAVGGGAANAAVTFSRQGFKTAALVKIGKDYAAEAILKNFKKEKISSLAIKDKKLGTAYSTILLMTSGERTILVYRGASADLLESEVPFAKLKTRWAYISPGSISVKVMTKVIDYLRQNKTLIAINPSKHYLEMGLKKLEPLLKKTQVVILNREEASYLTGIDYQKEKAIFKKFYQIINGLAVMTDGARGVLVSDGSKIYQAGIFQNSQVVDRTGAGDAFGSGFVAGLMATNDIKYAIHLGSANATSVIEKIGAEVGILRKKDLKQNRFKYLDLEVNPLSL